MNIDSISDILNLTNVELVNLYNDASQPSALRRIAKVLVSPENDLKAIELIYKLASVRKQTKNISICQLEDRERAKRRK